ncbi:hypothetical protein H9K76_13815 [Diaphorobacter ruginosibacter]|uniref:Uncharacterized protein n=1 Tax=Diaphorobacter ruginosibacter TaxID=1715720 RepID=A0A7G9RJD1_9BURK|nr:hypothetical protein [Diaphorobacter ruginosibacter]QNN55706.1 hypothetical protein H9K76_13815 [Diaphorobacter ruginosibacter]
MDIISTVWAGRAGLAKTYWGYGFLGSLIWALALVSATPGSALAMFAGIGLCVYSIAVNVGTLRAAGIYTGPTVWSMLAKVVAVLGIVFAAITLVVVLIALGSGGTVTIERQQPPIPPAATAPGNEKPRSEIAEFLKDAPPQKP